MSAGENSLDGVTFAPVKIQKRSMWHYLRWVVAGLAALALLITIVAAPQILLLMIAMTHLFLTGFLLITTIFGKRWLRAFAIGALVPNLIASLVMIPFAIQGEMEFFGVLLLGLVTSLIVGGVSTFSHGFLAKRNWEVKAPSFLRGWLDTE